MAYGLTSEKVKRGAHQQDSGWSVTHNPAANTTATITKAAPGAKKRLVITSLDVEVATAATAPTAAVVTVSLSDGTTTYWSTTIGLPATAGQFGGIKLDDVWIPMPENTLATLAFSGAGGANTHETVNMRGIIEELGGVE